MFEDTTDNQESSNPEEEQNLNSDGEENSETNEELEKANKIADNQRIRAEKAERELKQVKSQVLPEKTPQPMSLQDIRALQDIHDEQVESIVDYAKFKGVSILEAKKTPEMQALIKSGEEARAAAAAINVDKTGRGSTAPTDEDILALDAKGELSEEDIPKAAAARLRQKQKHK